MTVELAIVGAGPAGMAAAVLAGELGLDTMLVDEQNAPGGQIYRAIERAEPDTPLGRDYLAGRPLAAALRASRVTTGRLRHCGTSIPKGRCSWSMAAAPRQ
jgi:octopine oxidase subunit A